MKRPQNITILGVFVLAQGLVFTISASATLGLFGMGMAEALPTDVAAELPTITITEALFATASLVTGIVLLVGGMGILLLRYWAWLIVLIAQGIILATELIDYRYSQAHYLSMIAAVIIVLYLNQRDIQRTLRVAQYRADPASVRTAEADQAAMAERERELAESKF